MAWKLDVDKFKTEVNSQITQTNQQLATLNQTLATDRETLKNRQQDRDGATARYNKAVSGAKIAKAGAGELSVNEVVDCASLTACCRKLSPGSLPGLLDLLYISQ